MHSVSQIVHKDSPRRFWVADMDDNIIWLAFPSVIPQIVYEEERDHASFIARVVYPADGTPDDLFFKDQAEVLSFPIGAFTKMRNMLARHIETEMARQGIAGREDGGNE